MENESMIKKYTEKMKKIKPAPSHKDAVVVVLDERETVLPSGIVIPQTVRKNSYHDMNIGVVVRTSDGCECQVGDYVLFRNVYKGNRMRIFEEDEGVKLLLLTEKEQIEMIVNGHEIT